MGNIGLTSHAVLQKFANTINSQAQDPFAVGIGSHDLHEKEFQIYFQQKVEKIGHSHVPLNRILLKKFLAKEDENIYCLITEADFLKFSKEIKRFAPGIIQEEYILRRRLNIDGKFFKAIFVYDREVVFNYLMEKIYLLEKNKKLDTLKS